MAGYQGELPPQLPPMSVSPPLPASITPGALAAGIAVMAAVALAAPRRWWYWVPAGVVTVALINHPDFVAWIDFHVRRLT